MSGSEQGSKGGGAYFICSVKAGDNDRASDDDTGDGGGAGDGEGAGSSKGDQSVVTKGI